ncbi:MAG: peptidoglycan recognition protein family protein [Roseburia sp.]|nr:peptidoglycan recognition protein family protein [Roseburia sp.]
MRNSGQQRELSVYLPERRRPPTASRSRSVQGQRRVPRNVSKKQRARRRRVRRMRRFAVLMFLVFIAGAFQMRSFRAGRYGMQASSRQEDEGPELDVYLAENETASGVRIQEDFLSISEYNRPGTELSAVNNIFVHYTANPRTSAAQNRSYFESLGQTHERAASAHFIIGYDGEIIQCIPLEEEAYAVIGRNSDSISIECCYVSEDGAFTQETYNSLIDLLALLTERYELETRDILRHYDCGGKLCPLYYVEHEDAWRQLLSDVEAERLK